MHRAWTQAAPGLHWQPGQPVDVNSVLVMGRRRAVLVDSGQSLHHGEQLLADVRLLTDLPLSLVITHAHWDHCLGSGAMGAVPIWATETCAEDLQRTGAAQRDTVARGLAMSDPELAHQMQQSPIVIPNRILVRSATVDLGGRRVRLMHPGRGHTDNDLVVWIEDAHLLISGDLLEESGPPAFEDSFPLSWPLAVERILQLQPHLIIPGHGRPFGIDFATRQMGDLARLARHLRQQLAHPTRPQSPPPEWPAATLAVALAQARFELGRGGTLHKDS